ncbi:META domain-containing protein [Rhodanobacter aciditrophus]|uniref:META domain-containing protein n=1 Tax=Rhodanobacter aciditrophus TaxID=1623218 RepID=A0ABW4AYX7_9GAMM
MSYLRFGSCVFLASAITGCASQKAETTSYESVSVSDLTGQWQVESIDQGGVIDSSMVTLMFTGEGQVSGVTGCNQYSATMTDEGETVALSQAISTRMACAPALMRQEQRFLNALQETVTIHRLADTWLVAEDAAGKPRLKMIEMSSTPVIHDKASKSVTYFDCGSAGEVAIRLLREDAIQLTVGEQRTVLAGMETGSGAKYGEGELSFWQKGNEALFESGGRMFQCQQMN